MRKFTKMMFALAMLFGAVGGVSSVHATKLYSDLSKASAVGANVGNSEGTIGGWESSASGGYVFTWKGSWDARIVITDIATSLSVYDKLVVVCQEFTDAWRVDVELSGGSTKTIGGAFYNQSSPKTITLSDVLTNSERSSVVNIRINTASGEGSVRITDVYLEKPTTVSFNESGKAYFDWTDISVSGANLSYNDKTGEVVSTGTDGTINITFDRAYDLSTLSRWTAAMSGDDIVGHWKLVGAKNDGSELNMWSGEFDRTFPTFSGVTLSSPDFSAVTGITMYVNASGTMSFTKGNTYLTASVITATRGEEVAMSSLTNYHWNSETGEFETTGYNPSYRVNESTNIAYYGVDWSGENCQNYSDVEHYKAIRVYSAQGNVPRGMFFNSEANDQTAFNFTWKDTEGYYELLLSEVYASVHNYKLISVRPAQGTTSSITRICMVINNPTYDYNISGSGILVSSATAALADADATSIDATGITSATELTAANPNCLFVANADMVTNEKNVIVDGVCANLELTDGEPFKAPSAFTAMNAKFTRKFSSADYATMVVPFDVATLPTQPATVKAYKLKGVNGEAITTDVLTSLTANEPVMVKVTADDVNSYEFTASGVSVAVTSGDLVENGLLKATYATTTAAADANNYVLQKNGDDVNFYLVTGDAATVKPFRAYLHYENPGAHILSILFDDATGIEKVEKETSVKENGEFFNLAGQRVAQPTKGLYIVNGKKVVIK